MKYRNDFVTNSSSSSFIVSFKNKEDMETQFKKMVEKYPHYGVRVFEDIKKYKKTYGEVLEYIKERLIWEARYHIRYEMSEYADKKFDYEWFKSSEYKKIEKQYINKEIEKFKNSVNHRGYFAIVCYADDSDSELEHYIMPYLPFTVKTFSNH